MPYYDVVDIPYLRQPHFRKNDRIVHTAEIVKRNILQNAGHAWNGAVFFETARTNRARLTAVLYGADAKGSCQQPAFLVARLLHKRADVLLTGGFGLN